MEGFYLTNQSFVLLCAIFAGVQSGPREGDVGSLLDDEIPLVYCVRMVCQRFLLTGYPQGLTPDRKVVYGGSSYFRPTRVYLYDAKSH